jgi:hypothetical protein
MYKHLVFWKIKDTGDPLKNADIIEKVKTKLESLPNEIPEIKRYEIGVNEGSYGASFYDISLISVFENKDTFWAYTKYPVHDEVVAYIQSVQEGEQIVDYED